MKFRTTRFEVLNAFSKGKEDDFIELGGEVVEEQNLYCKCEGPWTCREHGGEFTFCDNRKCWCYSHKMKRNLLPLPEIIGLKEFADMKDIQRWDYLFWRVNEIIRYLKARE